MHHIYQTEGIILSSKPKGESGKILTVLSKEFGLIKIEAQAVRSNYSKLKSAIQDFSIAEISFVRGKAGNRLVSAFFISNLFYEIKSVKVIKKIKKVFQLLERLITDEAKLESIYYLVKKFVFYLKSKPELLNEDLNLLEISVVYNILSELGYLSKNNDFQILFKKEIDQNFLEKIRIINQKEIIKLINMAIDESHL